MTNGTNNHVVGIGTHFTTTFCQGPGSPTVAQDQMAFVLWPTYPITGGGGGTSRSYNPVTSCTDDTHLTVQFNWGNPTQSGMQHSTLDKFTQASWMSTAGVSNINFYDNVLMYISLWLRTGIDSYLHYARWLAQRFWTVPPLDRGNANGCAWVPANCSNTPIVPRNASLQGVVVEALYQDYVAGSAGASGIWAGLEELEPSWEFGMTSSLIGDLRESSYNDMQPALLAAYDPNTGPAASARAFLDTTLNGFWTGQKTADNHWQAAAYGYLSAPAKWTNGANTNVGGTITANPSSGTTGCPSGKDCITLTGNTWTNNYTGTSSNSLTPGAQTVSITTQSSLGYLNGNCVLLSSTAAPTAYMLAPITSYSGTTLAFTVTANTVNTPCSGFGGTGAHTDWQISSSTSAGQFSFQFPATFTSFYGSNNGTTRDQNVYQAVLVDSTHALLTSPYIDNCSAGGNSCSGRDWMICTGAPGSQWCGFGTQGFMLGITGDMFYHYMQGFARDMGTYSADYFLAESYLIDAANWVVKPTANGTGGVDVNVDGSGLKGAQYGTGFSICTPGAVDGSDGCRLTDISASRTNLMEAGGALALAYSYAPTGLLKANIDAIFGPAWAVNPGDIGYDGFPASSCNPAFLLISPKWPGFCLGNGRNAAYNALFNMPSVIAQLHWGH